MIVIFGAAIRADGAPSQTMRARVAAAFALGRTLTAPIYIPTGGVGRHGPSEASLMALLLREHGADPARIRLEETARNTIRSVQACRELLAGHTGPVYAATSAYHVPRCIVLLRIAGHRARACAPDGSFRLAAALREAIALPVDILTALWWRITGRL